MERLSRIREIMAMLFVLGMLFLSTQTVHFCYMLLLRPFDSYSAKYEADTLEYEGLTAEDLKRRHEEALRKVLEYKKIHPEVAQQEDRMQQTEPFRTENALRQAIDNHEVKLSAIYRVLFFWGAGALLYFLGIAATRSSFLFGLSLVIAGFFDMIGHTSPMEGGPVFIKLVTIKLVLSVLTIFFLVIAGTYFRILQDGLRDHRANESELG